ncbi:unnamed protein product, partial [Urochloa humidicola]
WREAVAGTPTAGQRGGGPVLLRLGCKISTSGARHRRGGPLLLQLARHRVGGDLPHAHRGARRRTPALRTCLNVGCIPFKAPYITGEVYLKPQELNGLFQYLAASYSDHWDH